jgi:hypothetical protein
LGGAAAEKGNDAVNELEMDCSSCGFGRVRCRPAKVIEGENTAAYYSKALCSPQSSARRLASPFFLPATSSYNEVFTVAQQAKADAALAEAEASRPGEG